MWFWLIVSTLIILVVVLSILGAKCNENFYFGAVICGIAAFVFLVSLLTSYDKNTGLMESGKKLARTILNEKRLEAKLEGNIIKISSSKFSIMSEMDMDLREKIIAQANYVDYNKYANADSWLNVFHPDPSPEEPLLKIEIVK